MDKGVRNFFLLLVVAVIAGAIILALQIQKARGISTRAENTSLFAPNAQEVTIYPTDPSFGNPGADLTLIEFIDMGNPTSREYHAALYRFAAAHPTKIRLIWKDLPQKHLFSGDSRPAHQAAHCAQKQNKFWEYVNELFSSKTNLSDADLRATAVKLGLNLDTWSSCLTATDVQQAVLSNTTLAPVLGVASAPAIFINNKRLDVSKDINFDQMLSLLISP